MVLKTNGTLEYGNRHLTPPHMIQILRKDGFILNPNDKAVNALLRMIERNEGRCPCSGNTSEDLHCPCSNYKLHNECTCGLYKKLGE